MRIQHPVRVRFSFDAEAARIPRLTSLLLLLTFLILLLHPAAACLSDQYESVHFNGGEPDFGDVPRRGMMLHESYSRHIEEGYEGNTWEGETELTLDRDDQLKAKKERRGDAVRERARADETRGAWAAAREEYARLAARDGWSGDLRDRVAVLDAAIGGAEMPPDLQRRYLRAMDSVHASYATKWTIAKTELGKIAADLQSGDLRPFALYQIASLYAGWFDYNRAIAGYQSLLKSYPRFLRREEATIMLARCAILPETAGSRRPEIGAQGLHQLLTEFPHTRFRRAATGLQARLDLLAGNYGDAIARYFAVDDTASIEIVLDNLPHAQRDHVYPQLLCAYLQRLNRATSYYEFAQAIDHIQRTMALLTPNGADNFVAALRRSPTTLGPPYFYYRIYHCDNTSRDLRHLAALADSMKMAANAMSPLLRVRFAEVFYHSERMSDALRWANAATSASAHPYDRALYVRGAALHRLHRTATARAVFETLLSRCPNSYLRGATRENVALIAEEQGDLSGALDNYLALDYTPDIAFFLDVRMTTAQVAAYIAAHPRHPKHNLFVYSLGMRYLRDEKWAEARRAFVSLPHKYYVDTYRGPRDPDSPGGFGWSWHSDDLPQQSPLQTIADLSRLQRSAQSATTDAGRASALFHYASYYDNHGTLLLYNGALWNGSREYNFDFQWNDRHATVEDGKATRRHMYAHETYARTQAICERIARDYPHTPTAPYALYRAGCCASKLANFNGWWRMDDAHHGHYADAARLMRHLHRLYPHSSLDKEAQKFAAVFREAAEREVWYQRKNPQDSADDTHSRNEDL